MSTEANPAPSVMRKETPISHPIMSAIRHLRESIQSKGFDGESITITVPTDVWVSLLEESIRFGYVPNAPPNSSVIQVVGIRVTRQ